MKKIYLPLIIAGLTMGASHAQTSKGGLPWSLTSSGSLVHSLPLKALQLDEPDYDQYAREDAFDAESGAAKPYRVAAKVESRASFGRDGEFYYNADGTVIWRLAIKVPGAKALNLHYSNFHLPKGVSLFISNENGRQLIGAFTSDNNPTQTTIFSTEEVEGAVSILEMNIDKGVNMADIKLDIDKVFAFYRGYETVAAYASESGVALRPTLGESSSCHINAKCPIVSEDPFMKSRNGTVRILGNGGVCTGTLINNTGNANGGPCIPYVLTASHCEGDNSRDPETFAGLQFRFNYQFIDCDGPTLESSQTVAGSELISRSNLPSFATPENSLVADFMLLKITGPIPANTNAYLVGWNRAVNIWNDEDYDLFVGYHHPSGDSKKMAKGSTLFANGTFNQQAVANTHWSATWSQGGTSKGSSGSGLFEKDGLLMGDLSGGAPGTCDGKDYGASGLYSKISYAWENEFDQVTFPSIAGPSSRLKDWLDPANTDATRLWSTKYDCSDVSVKDVEAILSNSVAIYPNPTTDGKISIKVNLPEQMDLEVSIMDIRGVKIAGYSLNKVRSNVFEANLGHVASGMYIVRFASPSGDVSVAKKVFLTR